jgi:hypothetical protein
MNKRCNKLIAIWIELLRWEIWIKIDMNGWMDDRIDDNNKKWWKKRKKREIKNKNKIN